MLFADIDEIIDSTPIDKDTNVPTNAYRIRAMSDEELAEFICGRCHFKDLDNTMCGAIISCDGNCLEWLKQPAEE
jgi:hypothetical protein